MEPDREPKHLAEWGPRIGATLLDALIVGTLSVAALIATAIIAVTLGASSDLSLLLWLALWVVLCAGYVTLTMGRKGRYNGQTLGRQAANVRVVRDDGREITHGNAFVRDFLLKFVAANAVFGIGWIADSLWPLGESEGRTLHDLAAGTHVIGTAPAPQPQIEQPPPAVAYPVLAPPIARHFDAARRIQYSIGMAVQRTQLPYGEVSREIDGLINQLWQSALRANMLHEALEETPVARVEQRLAELQLKKSPELVDALREQLIVQRRMRGQLDRYDAEMERIVVELDTVRANIVSVSASGDIGNQQRLASTVRHLRDEMSAVGEGMSQAYDS